ncbi:MAG: glycosyltransferase family 2 protein [Actinobacteria bacterium]|nr:glycosyltransferase family 2 protein [Actinomycetota bacterium]
MDVSIIIVNFNGLGIIEDCIRSIYKYAGSEKSIGSFSYEIIVADNASYDGSARMIEEMAGCKGRGNLKVILLEKNYGFAHASNVAAKASGGDYLLFLNPDTELIEPGLESFIDFYKKKSASGKTGAAAVKLLNDDMSLQYSCRSFLTLARQFYESFFLSRLFKKSRVFGSYFMTFSNHGQTMEVDWLSGAFMFIARDIFFAAGCFDMDYFMYSEDSDLCLKLARLGYKNYYYPFYCIKHKDAAIASSDPSARDLQIARSRKLYFKKNYSNAHSSAFSIIYFFHIIIRIAIYYIISLAGKKNIRQKAKIRAGNYIRALKMYFCR